MDKANLDDMARELKRLQAIEQRLIDAHLKADKLLDVESSLIGVTGLRSTMRECEYYLGYRPKIVQEDETVSEDGE